MELTLAPNPIAPSIPVTPNTLAVAALFGLGLDGAQRLRRGEGLRIPITPGTIVLITGPSGAGKTSLLNGIARELSTRRVPLFHLNTAGSGTRDPGTDPLIPDTRGPIPDPRFPEPALVDCLALPLPDTLSCLARAGLADACTLLRRPSELSAGERFRFELARFYAGPADILLADEFCAALDRLTARIAAWQLRKFITASRASGQPRTAILATSHEDLTADLRPDLILTTGFGGACEVARGPGTSDEEPLRD